jgi:hypothetical protein
MKGTTFTTYTVVAPTDDAFMKLPTGLVDRFWKDRETLIKWMSYYVIPTQLNSVEITGAPKTLEGESLVLAGGVPMKAANFISKDVATDNGTLHTIDRVLFPPSILKMLQREGLVPLSVAPWHAKKPDVDVPTPTDDGSAVPAVGGSAASSDTPGGSSILVVPGSGSTGPTRIYGAPSGTVVETPTGFVQTQTSTPSINVNANSSKTQNSPSGNVVNASTNRRAASGGQLLRKPTASINPPQSHRRVYRPVTKRGSRTHP